MFQSDELKNHLETSSVVRTQTAVIAEWNMNIPTNISRIGNYRYRPTTSASNYQTLTNTFDQNDSGNYYTNATDADVVIDGGYDDSNEPIILTANKDKIKMLYSLEDCFKPFRPRSGINKARYFSNSYLHHSNVNMAKRPRYYMADKDDKFKYWSSYRTENGVEYGIANKLVNGQYNIEDSVPFVVYENKVPLNRVAIKMQTNIGSLDLGTFSNSSSTFSDPFYGNNNKTTPVRWKVQSLKSNNWVDVMSFNQSSTRRDGSPIIPADGYVELSYGLIIPEKYRDIFIFAESYSSVTWLPQKSINGYSYFISSNDLDIGTYHIWVGDKYEQFVPTYGWQLEDETVTRTTNFVTDLTNPAKFTSTTDNSIVYRELDYTNGLRIVVDTMNKVDATFDLIELSPRLSVNLSDKTSSYSITKMASDLGVTGLPVSQLLASTGSLSLFDYDDAFQANNLSSIIKDYISRHIQFKFYEIIVDVNGYDYYIPVKTMYSEGFPEVDNSSKHVDLKLRDFYFYFESIMAPQILSTNTSLSAAVSLLLDSIGFSNYVFNRVPGEKDLVIPFFFIPPDKNVAEILQDLAMSTQTAMFFDEYNNFVMMSKNYIMPLESERQTDFILDGNTNNANIIEISGQDTSVYNDGTINYETRYIQRSVGSIRQASLVDIEKSWIYKPVLLWEVSGTSTTKSVNNQVGDQSTYVLSAIPLNSNLSLDVPTVSNHKIVNNTMDLGEGVYWITRYNGYFYSNGEIIKFDAVQYNISGYGNVWINNVQEYENYFSKLPFNGKIYPTGLVRIYSEPNYEEINGTLRLKDGAVAKHGRGQFGTAITKHSAGLDPYWSDNANVRGCTMESKHLFSVPPEPVTAIGVSSVNDVITVSSTGLIKTGYLVNKSSGTGSLSTEALTLVTEIINETSIRVSPAPTIPFEDATIVLSEYLITSPGAAGVSNTLAQKTTRNGIIKNFLSSNYTTESDIANMKITQTGTIQSSAMVMNGPSFTTTESPLDFISYVKKPLTDKYKHFGTRVRIIGKIENNMDRGQTAIGSSTYYVVPGSTPDQNINIAGGSGGLGVLINPETNNGYYFEIVALGTTDLDSLESSNVNNILFYKIEQNAGKAIPVKLWEGLSNIIVDDGKFTGQYRMAAEQNPTVYDLSVEYQDIGNIRRFYLYINNKLITTVDDKTPLPAYNNMALFVRGSSRLMFENIYALTNNYSQNTSFVLDTPVNSIFDDAEIDANESFRKYSMSGIVQGTYLSGISSYQPPEYKIYFEEFGTIMREASTFNIRYDKAYPALYAKLSPTFNRIKGYTVSGFRAGSYGAEFMIFNATDTALSLDETTGNYLRIQGVTFTQESRNSLTVDQYFTKNSDFSNPEFKNDTLISSPFKSEQAYEDIKLSRMTYGKKDFSLNVPYIQTEDDANELMKWVTSKIIKPRKSFGIKIFSIPTLQLGDIVKINYSQNDVSKAGAEKSRYVIYNIQHSKDFNGPSMTIYLSEVA